MVRDCSTHKKPGLNKLLCLSSVVNPFPSPLYLFLSNWCCFVVTSQSRFVHTSHPSLPPSKACTSRGQGGETIHPNLASRIFFHLVSNHEWSLDSDSRGARSDPVYVSHAAIHLFRDAFSFCSSRQRCTCSNCQTFAFVWRRGRAPHYGSHCASASVWGSWSGKMTHCGTE